MTSFVFTVFVAVVLLNDQFTVHVGVECAGVVVGAFDLCDIAPRCTRLDGAGIENRLLALAIRSCGVGHDVVVLPFHYVSDLHVHGRWLKFEGANLNRNYLWLGAS